MTTANVKVTENTVKTAQKPVSITVAPDQPKTPEHRLREVDNVAIWTVMGLPDCPWTEAAINILKEHKEKYKLVFINREWQRKLIVEYDCRRSPAIFKGTRYIGSYADLENYYKCWFFSDSELL
jgi:glutaredoxin